MSKQSGGGGWLLVGLVALAVAASHPSPVNATTTAAVGSWPGAAAAGMPPIFDCIVYNESRGDPRAVNPRSGATGLIQFMPSTAVGIGFPRDMASQPVSVQIAAAKKLFARDGLAPWRGDGCI